MNLKIRVQGFPSRSIYTGGENQGGVKWLLTCGETCFLDSNEMESGVFAEAQC
jgi:hypothetical protein